MPDGDIKSATVLFHYTDEKADKNIASLNSLIVGRKGERHYLFEDVTAADDLVLRGEPRITWQDRSKMERHHFLVYAMLSIINSPTVFRRERHEPHRAVVRQSQGSGQDQRLGTKSGYRSPARFLTPMARARSLARSACTSCGCSRAGGSVASNMFGITGAATRMLMPE
jgi:hypothetical protein